MYTIGKTAADTTDALVYIVCMYVCVRLSTVLTFANLCAGSAFLVVVIVKYIDCEKVYDRRVLLDHLGVLLVTNSTVAILINLQRTTNAARKSLIGPARFVYCQRQRNTSANVESTSSRMSSLLRSNMLLSCKTTSYNMWAASTKCSGA
jgi:hypothetical protein